MKHDSLEQYRHGYEKGARFYNLFAQNDDIPFYTAYAKEIGSPILELAAGAGRVSIVLAQHGLEVTALESSAAMLTEFKNQLATQPHEVARCIHLVEGDMTNFALGKTFPLIIIPTSFGHALTTDDQLSLLTCVRNHLAEDGVFLMDLFPGGIQPRSASFEENPVDIENDQTVTRSGVIITNPISQIISLDLTFTIRDKKSGRVVEEIHQRSGAALVYNREVDLLLRMSKLRIIEEFGDFERTPYSSESGRRILVVGKD